MKPTSLLFSTFLLPGLALAAEPLTVDPESGRNNFSAVFDAPLGERINAVSSKVGCELTLDGNVLAGSCAVPLSSVMVDNEPTKTEHFQQWATNKKSKPEDCKLEAKFGGVKFDPPLEGSKGSKFSAEAAFTVCGKARADGGKEKVEGTAMVLPASGPGSTETVRVRAHIEKFNRDAYKIGPKYTDGWLARVQQLGPVVAENGAIDFSLFATGAAAAEPAKSPEKKNPAGKK